MINLSAETYKEFLDNASANDIKALARSANVVLNESAFNRALNEIVQDLVFRILDTYATSDEEANILRRSVDNLMILKSKLEEYKTNS
jgi:hypothetical protein